MGTSVTTNSSPVSRSNFCLYFILGLVLLNVILISALAGVLFAVATRAEPEAKKFSREHLADVLLEFKNNKENDALIEELSVALTEAIEEAAPGLTKDFVASTTNSLLPYDIFSVAEYILRYDFTDGVELFADTMDSASKSFLINPDFEQGGEVVSAIAAISRIVAEVEPLSTDTELPENYEDFSMLGQALLRAPTTFVNSLTESVWKKASFDCATLSNRLYFTDFSGTYETQQGETPFDFNENVRPVFSGIYQICATIASSPPV